VFIPVLVGARLGVLVTKSSVGAGRVPERALQLVLAATLFVVASRIAYGHAPTAVSIFTAFTRRAVP
jgi:hypothetical protein